MVACKKCERLRVLLGAVFSSGESGVRRVPASMQCDSAASHTFNEPAPQLPGRSRVCRARISGRSGIFSQNDRRDLNSSQSSSALVVRASPKSSIRKRPAPTKSVPVPVAGKTELVKCVTVCGWNLFQRRHQERAHLKAPIFPMQSGSPGQSDARLHA